MKQTFGSRPSRIHLVVIPLVSALVGTLIGLLVATVWPTTYTAQSEVFFGADGDASASESQAAASLVRAQMTSYAELVTSQAVLDAAAGDVGLPVSAEKLARRVKATVPFETVVLKIEARATTAEQAAALANAVAVRVSEKTAEVSPGLADGSAIVRPITVTQAERPSTPTWPSMVIFSATGFFFGLLVGSVLAAAAMSRRVTSAENGQA